MSQKKIAAVIGNPVSHSLSPRMHNAGYGALSIDSEFTYLPITVGSDQLARFWSSLEFYPFAGLSVTYPLKEAVIPYVHEVTEAARIIGAINTIYPKGGIWIGENTDHLGVKKALEQVRPLTGERVLIIGAGGAARAAVYACTAAGADVLITNRTIEKGERLAEEFSSSFKRTAALSPSDFTIVCNMTTVGMNGDVSALPIPKELLLKSHLVLDAVYKPFETPLLKAAIACGAMTISGIDMLLYQGIKQFELFTGKEAPIKEMRASIAIGENHG